MNTPDPIKITDVIDLQFVQTDLKDMPISDAEHWQSAACDAEANEIVDRRNGKQVPVGKRVE